jgi:hypothetical protein
LGTDVLYQLYAAVHDWQTGTHRRAEFSLTGFIDVYNGHIGTFRDIANKHNTAFHLILCDIYTKARCAYVLDADSLLIKHYSSGTAAGELPGVPIAELDLETLEF